MAVDVNMDHSFKDFWDATADNSSLVFGTWFSGHLLRCLAGLDQYCSLRGVE